jgi:predicted glutamine amidotransferase
VVLDTLLIQPEHSLIRQSYHSTERSEPMNADGFGVGWYAPRLSSEPGVFHAITPAWNNLNLASLAKVVASPCVLAHVRAASPGSEVDLANCHPFRYGRYLLMHNGRLGSFHRVRRRLLDSLTDEAFGVVRGSTDTEHLLALFVDEVVRNGGDGQTHGGHGGLDGALELASRLTEALARALEVAREVGDGQSSLLNVAVSDGERAVVTRFGDDPKEGPETLYVHCGELYEPAHRRFAERRPGDEGTAVVVSSERLTHDPAWSAVPPNHVVVVSRGEAPRLFALGRDGRITGEVGAAIA